LCAWLVPGHASARKQSELLYGFDQIWNAALRMVRVDLRLPVTDRDPEAGYLLFDYIDHDKRYPGSVELVRGERDRRPLTKVVIQVQGMPAYVEQMLLDRLERKLRDEYGEPLQPSKAPKEPAPKPAEEPKQPDSGEAPSGPSN
jgi:hypothetical protein